MESIQYTGRTEVVYLEKMSLVFQKNGSVVLLEIPGTTGTFVPVFSHSRDILEAMLVLKVFDYTTKNICDFDITTFLQGLKHVHVKLMVNPCFADGKIRYMELDPTNLQKYTPQN
jgi:hypothetical protein